MELSEKSRENVKLEKQLINLLVSVTSKENLK